LELLLGPSGTGEPAGLELGVLDMKWRSKGQTEFRWWEDSGGSTEIAFYLSDEPHNWNVSQSGRKAADDAYRMANPSLANWADTDGCKG
jgi:hypothetical protein